jgi:ubiquinone/menaquinone biosynthesis C-methylase UbiE
MCAEPLREIIEHYEQSREAERLFVGPGALERVRTQQIISRHLVPPPAQILDVGGGPGTYALWLLRQGYEVALVDPVPMHVAEAARQLEEYRPHGRAIMGDARRLAWADQSCDGVLLLGPLYHLTERSDRIRALAETRRVLRPGGLAFVAAISRFASLLDGFSRRLIDDPAFVSILHQDLTDGQHRNADNANYFTTAFFHRPEELIEEIRAAGLELHALLGVEGPFWFMSGFAELWQEPQSRELMLDMLSRVESEPSVLGASAHWLAVVRRQE